MSVFLVKLVRLFKKRACCSFVEQFRKEHSLLFTKLSYQLEICHK